MNGWIKLHRQFLNWEWFNKSEAVHLFMYLLLKANHKDGTWQGINLKKGQFVTSYGKISSDTGISLQTVRTLLKKFQNTNEINTQTTNKYTVVTICKYADYQTDEIETNTQPTSKQQSTNKQLTTNNNDKKEKNILFDKFWTMYGKSVDKKKCKDKFVLLSESEIDLIFETLPIYLLKTPDVQFRKNPLTYINGKCWNDIDLNNPQLPINPYNLPPVVWEG